ncbi:MAG: DUF4347 domain-containing protein [Nostoc sp. JL31]|nr:DUF4347 domain-containing protein [Nostoc sp. JL31]
MIGNAALGGNWELEIRTAQMEVTLPFTETTRKAYAGVLATFTVNNTGDADDGDGNNGVTTLREAINLANATTGDDAITFGGVFKDTTPDIITLTSGQLKITDDVTILGTGASNLTVSGNNASRVFEISGLGRDVSIDGLKVANGNDSGILVNNNTLLSLTNSNVSNNTATSNGGGINNKGTLKLTNTNVSGNTATSSGGGISNQGVLSLTKSSVSDNTATSSGSGIYSEGILNVTESSISGNTTSSTGGGIYTEGNFKLTNSTVSNNTANNGAGIYNGGDDLPFSIGTATLTNSTVSGNKALDNGGGIYDFSDELNIINSTITNNNATGNYGIYAENGGVFNGSNGTVILGNTIIAGNLVEGTTYLLNPDVEGNFTDLGYNLIGNNIASTGFTTSTLVGTSANPIDPKLSPLQNNGDATFTNALIGNSPAINAGNNALIPAGITTDQRGAGFDRISEGTVDIGALEFNGVNGTNGADNLAGKNYGDIINAQAGNDTITGNQGNDILTGGGGKDKFIYNLGDGVDTITDFGGLGKGSNPSAAIASELDTLKFQGAGLTARNLQLTQNGNNLELTFEGVADDKVILQNFPLENLDNLSTLGNILFDGQSSIRDSFDIFNANSTQSTIFNKNTVTFLNDLNNNVDGFDNSDDVINGQGGDDRIDGKSGNDLLKGGVGYGQDTLIGGAGDDILVGGTGQDSLIGGAGDDILVGGSNSDTLTGGNGHDQFISQTLDDIGDTITDFNQSEDKLVLTDLFKSRGYSSSNPIGDGNLQFLQSGTSTEVKVFAYYSFYTLATLDNFTATNLVIGSNVLV